MDPERKKEIDKLWMETEYGQWVLNAAAGNEDEAEKLAESIFKKPPFFLESVDRELAEKIASELKYADEFDDYMKALDSEDYDLVGFMISHDTFGYVYDLMRKAP